MKSKICKGCQKEFVPERPLQTVCNLKCFYKYKDLKKKLKHEKLKEEVRDYKKLAWKQFSYNIRYSQVDKDRKVQCYTCPKKMPPEEADAGHYKHNKLDYYKMNVHIQCTTCNRFLSGNRDVYYKNLVRDYGQDAVDDLERRANESKPLKRYQHKEMYEYYKELNKSLNK